MFPLYYYYNNTFLLQLFLINFINLYRFYYRQQQQRSRPQHISPRSQSRQNVCQNRPQTVHTVQSGRIQKNRQKSPIKKTFRSFGISSLLGLPTRIAKNSRAFGISELLSRKESNQQLGCNQPIHTAPQTNRKSGFGINEILRREHRSIPVAPPPKRSKGFGINEILEIEPSTLQCLPERIRVFVDRMAEVGKQSFIFSIRFSCSLFIFFLFIFPFIFYYF